MLEHNSRILIIDGDVQFREHLAAELLPFGVLVSGYQNADEAFRDFPKMPFDLILANVAGAPGNGVELIYLLGKLALRIPVALITDFPDDQKSVHDFAGAFAYLAKPLPAWRVRELLRAAEKP